MIVGILIYLALAGLIYVPVQWFAAQPRNVAMLLFGRDLVEGRETGGPTPVWLETTLLWCTRLVHAPLAVCLLGLVSGTAFRRIRSQLLPFLASRCIVAGAGMVDDAGDFLVADKAPAINCVLGLGGFLKDRPIFTFAHFFQGDLCGIVVVAAGLPPPLAAAAATADRPGRHEHGRHGRVPAGGHDGPGPGHHRSGRAAAAARACSTGGGFTATVQRPDSGLCGAAGGRPASDGAAAAAAVPAGVPAVPGAARRTRRKKLTKWWPRGRKCSTVLEQLQLSGEVPQSLIGSVDWITKRHLLEEAGKRRFAGNSPHDRRLLSRTLAARVLPDAAGRRLGRRMCQSSRTGTRHADAAPANTPATMRGPLHPRVLPDSQRTDGQLVAGRARPGPVQQIDSSGAIRASRKRPVGSAASRHSRFRTFERAVRGGLHQAARHVRASPDTRSGPAPGARLRPRPRSAATRRPCPHSPAAAATGRWPRCRPSTRSCSRP